MHHNHLTDIFDDMGVEGPLPPWAVRKSNGTYMELYAQLPTRDGRKIGNAVIVAIESSAFAIIATVKTDIGNSVRMVEKELEEYFHPPKYIMDITYGRSK